MLRRHKGTTLLHPSWVDTLAGFQAFPIPPSSRPRCDGGCAPRLRAVQQGKQLSRQGQFRHRKANPESMRGGMGRRPRLGPPLVPFEPGGTAQRRMAMVDEKGCAMNKNAVEDLRWIATELGDLSALLQVYSEAALGGNLGPVVQAVWSAAELIEATLKVATVRPAPNPARRRQEFRVIQGGRQKSLTLLPSQRA